ncbi:uncharacterized protein LOC124157726 [Ischnura elegans]|uniref:uncharacterized protein LOC124157726 n=1 Tax=Ischnura elegans TaxID=197161 RepID=UPI001ED87833|nr:uncharacterized protein LOC124157726 [Ischnura elegans]XP_046388658.1 uncharacterized protein LOC124157726 [Ischnura elegans]
MGAWKSVEAYLPIFVFILYQVEIVVPQVAWTPIYMDGKSQVDLWTVSDTGCSCSKMSASSKYNYSSASATRGGNTPISATSMAMGVSSPPSTPAKDSCACCVSDGGCPCGAASPNRCTQCGLEAYCMQMCNVTLDSKALKSRSGKTFGQIKSPSLVGPGSCWYLLLPDRNQRIEIQVYRLVSVGHFNGSSCQSGFLELTEGPDAAGRKGKGKGSGVIIGGPPRGGSGRGLQLCGENERFAPPAVMFADRTSATLLFQIGEPTLRSQFFAYFSFTPSDHKTLGIANRGGKRVDHTDCDWVYQEELCKKRRWKTGEGEGKVGRLKAKEGGENREEMSDEGGCIIASPGYPGIYPPNRVCKYLVNSSSNNSRINVTFTSLLLPYNLCDTDYIVIHKGPSISSPVLTRICGSRKTHVEYSGPSMLIEFRSGPSIPPYDYNGFTARLDFISASEDTSVTDLPLGFSTSGEEPGILMDETRKFPKRIPNTICDYVYYGNTTRSGLFDTRVKGLHLPYMQGLSSSSGPVTCKLVFYGKSSDIVYMSLFSFDLRAPACESSIEVFDGKQGKNSKCVQKICSPFTRKPEEQKGSFSEQKSIVSTGNVLTIVFHQAYDSSKEYIEGAFLFHDERLEGALQTSALCDVVYDGTRRRGRNSKKEEPFAEPLAAHHFWRNVDGPLRCTQRFDVEKGQTITLKITAGERLVSDPRCTTRCQTENGGGGIMDEDIGGGCSCMTNTSVL